jgi:predicted nucleic acid-binding protein
VIILDTNVVSEVARPRPMLKVLEWMRSQPRSALFTSAITEAELFYGVALLPEGRRRSDLEMLVNAILSEDLSGKILPFDSAAAREYADIAATRRGRGRPISEPDARVAAIARSRGASLATRNTADFENCGVELIDPWA